MGRKCDSVSGLIQPSVSIFSQCNGRVWLCVTEINVMLMTADHYFSIMLFYMAS